MRKVLKSVCIHVTGMCNLNCKHCFTRDKCSELNYYNLSKFVHSLKELGLSHISISGGEPTLHKDLDKIILDFCEIANLTLTTNGSDCERIQKVLSLIKDKLNIRVSLDGTKNIHESLRGKNTYKRALNTIKTIKKKLGWVGVNTVLHKGVEHCLFDLVKILNELSVNHWALMTLCEDKNKDIRYEITQNKLDNLEKEFSGNFSFWDYGKDGYNYLLVREDGFIVLPGYEKSKDLIIGNIEKFSLQVISKAINKHRKAGHHFDWRGV